VLDEVDALISTNMYGTV